MVVIQNREELEDEEKRVIAGAEALECQAGQDGVCGKYSREFKLISKALEQRGVIMGHCYSYTSSVLFSAY